MLTCVNKSRMTDRLEPRRLNCLNLGTKQKRIIKSNVFEIYSFTKPLIRFVANFCFFSDHQGMPFLFSV